MWYEAAAWALAAACAYGLVVVGINMGWLPEPEERRRVRIHEAVLKMFSALCFIQEERFLEVMLPGVAELPYGGGATQVSAEAGPSRKVCTPPYAARIALPSILISRAINHLRLQLLSLQGLVEPSTVGVIHGRGLVATRDIARGSVVTLVSVRV